MINTVIILYLKKKYSDKYQYAYVHIKETDYPGHDNKPVMDLDQWPDNVPVAEVVDQFQKELDTFRATGN